MFGPTILNILAISRWVAFVTTSPQGYYRSGYRYDDIDANKEGSYRTTGYLGAYDGYNGRSYGGGDRCPYVNENTLRKKREADVDEISESEKKEVNVPAGGILLERLKRHDPYIRDAEDRYFDDRSGYYDRDRYRDDRYRDDRYRDDRYGDDRYRYRDDPLYKDRYGDWYREDRDRDDRYRYDRDRYDGYDGRGRGYGRDRCGREICTWEAQLECDLSQIGRGYGRSRYSRIRWERENDAYYPRDKYRDLQQYFGTRMRDYGEEVLTITRVKPEDKGVYRCYLEDGDEGDFMEIHFFPKFPVDANAIDDRDC